MINEIEAVLRGIEARTKHSHVCLDRNEASREANPCVCDYAARVRAEQARAIERMLHAAIHSTDIPVTADVWSAALRAGEEPLK